MIRHLSAALAAAAFALPALSDEFTDTLEGALQAYQDGDINAAQQDLDYAMKLIGSMKAETLAGFLPEAQPGWTRADATDAESSGLMSMLGGGTSASASYGKGNEEMTITLVANSPMVSGMAAMLSGISTIGSGKPIRIQRTQFTMNEDDLQGVVNGKVLVTVSGNATLEEKTAHLETMDFKALGDF